MKLALLLRGINVGGNNKIAMSDLKALLADLGYEDVKTILNSGNAVVETSDAAAKAESRVSKAIASELKLKIEVMARTHKELAAVVKADPLGKLVTNPSHYAVAFLREAPPKNALDRRRPRDLCPRVLEARRARALHLVRQRPGQDQARRQLLGEEPEDGRHRPQLEHRRQAARPDRALASPATTQRYFSRKSPHHRSRALLALATRLRHEWSPSISLELLGFAGHS